MTSFNHENKRIKKIFYLINNCFLCKCKRLIYKIPTMNREVCGLVNSIRDKPKIIARGYLLIQDKCNDNRYYWRCESKHVLHCKGRAITELENEEHILKKFTEHN